MALTGGLLAQGERAMAWFYPELYASTGKAHLPPEDIYAKVAAERPDLTMRYLRYPDVPGVALLGMGEAAADTPGSMARMFALGPETGAVVGVQPALSNIVILAAYLHVSLFMGEAGRNIIGIFGIGLLLVVITGFITWWPGWRNMRWGFRVRRTGKARVLLYDLHRVGGAIFGILIVFIALAGVLLSYPDFTARLFQLDTPTTMPMTMTHESGDTPRVDMGTAYGVARGAFPGLRLASAETPMGPEGKYRFIFHDERGRRYAALVAADHPMLVPVVDPRRGGSAAMVESSLYPLHTGAFFADAGRWSAMGLAGMVVFWALSGLYLYLSRPRKRSGKPSRATAPAQ